MTLSAEQKRVMRLVLSVFPGTTIWNPTKHAWSRLVAKT